MRREFAFALIALSAATAATSQTAPAAAPSTTPGIYIVGSGVTVPQLLPGAYDLTVPHHCKKLDGTVLIGLNVDTQGNPQDARVLRRSTSPDLDHEAINVAAADRFKPAVRDGAPVAIAIKDEIGLETCDLTRRDSSGVLMLHLRSAPSQKLDPLSALLPPLEPAPGVFKPGGRISEPVVIHSVHAQFTDDARRANYQGICLISLIVDAQGNPQNVRVARPLGMGLDEKALEAVRQYKFKPALKDGKTPVPVMVTIEIDFRLIH